MARTENRTLTGLDLSDALDPASPKGLQIRVILEGLAAQLEPGSPIPSERAIADHFGVARMTVRNEITRLANDGVLVVRPSAGAFVAEQLLSRQQLGMSFTMATDPQVGSAGARVLERQVQPATARIAALLGVDDQASILRVVRLRTVRGEPVGIERANLPLSRFPGLDLLPLDDVSLYRLIEEQYGIKRSSLESSARAVLPDDDEAKKLGCGPLEPCLAVTTTVRDADGLAIETGRSTYRGDRYELTASWRIG